MSIDLRAFQSRLEELEPGLAFIEHLGWSWPSERDREWRPTAARGQVLEQRAVAEWSDVIVLEVRSQDGAFPAPKVRAQFYEHLSHRSPAHLVIFVDGRRTRSLWRWMRHQDGGTLPRSYVYLRGQSVRHLLDEVANLHADIGGKGKGRNRALADMTDRLREAMDTRGVRERLTTDLQQQQEMLTQRIHGVPDAKLRWQYSWVLLNRLTFFCFIQQGGLLEGLPVPPREVPMAVGEREPRLFSRRLVKELIFEGLIRPDGRRPSEVQVASERLTLLRGSLFLAREVEEAHPDLDISDAALEELLQFAGRYSWHLDALPQGANDVVTPEVLARSLAVLFQRQSGQPVPPPEVSRYLCESALHPVILDAVHSVDGPRFKSMEDLLLDMDAEVGRRLLFEILPNLRILDPSCGPGVLLGEALETLATVYLAVIHQAETGKDPELLAEAARWRLGYSFKRKLLTGNLFGVSMDEATAEAARSHLLLGLLSATERKEQFDCLPRLDFNILTGDPLVGSLDTQSAQRLESVEPLWGLVEHYRSSGGHEGLALLRDWIHELSRDAASVLERQLRDELQSQEFQLVPRPLHWCLELGEVFRERGGFDAIVTAPPWDVLDAAQPKKELFRRLYPRSLRSSGRVPAYLLFIERALQLLRAGGQAAMFVPGSFYAQQTGRGLREMLLEEGALRTVLGFSNEFRLFDELHRSIRLCLLVLGKGVPADSFEAAFRIDPRGALGPGDLDAFLHDSASRLSLSLESIQRLSPGSLSLPELQSTSDLALSMKLMEFPLLETHEAAGERLSLGRGLEFGGATASRHQVPILGKLPICRGRAIVRYGLDASALYRVMDEHVAVRRLRPGLLEGLHTYRLALRTIARSTDTRTLTATILPPGILCDSTVMVETSEFLHPMVRFYLVALFNSFTLDYLTRQRMAGPYIPFSALMTLPIPQDLAAGSWVRALALRAARLICTTPAFADAARSVGLRDHQDGVSEPAERARLQAEIDGLVAHLYRLTEQEFTHVLSTFPLVPAPHTTAARNAYRDVAHGVVE